MLSCVTYFWGFCLFYPNLIIANNMEFELYDENAVLRLMMGGDQTAFRQLFDHHRRKIYYVAQKLLRDDNHAADVLQEVFVKVWLHRGMLAEITNFNAWLNTVLRNEIFTVFRETRREEYLLRGDQSVFFHFPVHLTGNSNFFYRWLVDHCLSLRQFPAD